MRVRFGIDIKSKESAGIVLIAGLVVVLASFSKRWFKPPRRQYGKKERAQEPRSTVPRQARTDFFQIRQTRSELGFVYWVLQGNGRFLSFTLFDTWQEAMDSANQRLSECRQEQNLATPHLVL